MGEVAGFVAPGFEPVRDAFAALPAANGAQFCAYAAGQVVVDVWAGDELSADTLLGVFSVTKAVAGVCVALLVQDRAIDLDAPLARYWPDFAAAGKAAITVRQALSHQAGVVGTQPPLTLAEVLDHDAAATKVAAQLPQWHPGAAHGYHAFTLGTMLEELVRRVTGTPVADFFAHEIADPRGIDFFVATPQTEEFRVLPLLPPLPADSPAPRPPRDTLPALAISPVFGHPLLPNLREVRAAGLVAGGGTGSARGLARLFAMCLTELDGHPPVLSPLTLDEVTQLQSAGEDLIQRRPTRFAIVFQKPDDRLTYGSHRAFGHDGAGGAFTAADPARALAYAYIPRRFATPAGAPAEALALIQLLTDCAAG